MTLSLIAALLVSLVIGSAVMWRMCPRTVPTTSDGLLVLSLGIGSGLGLCSLLLFLWLALSHGNGTREPILAVLLAILLAGAAALRWRRPAAPSPDVPGRLPWLKAAFGIAAVAAVVSFVLFCLHAPSGGWDAWSAWNRDARFMFRGGEHWRDVLSSAEAGWTPGYPMLTPGAVAYCWYFVKTETLLAPNAIGFLFTLSVVGLLVSSLSLLRSGSQGLIAGIILLCSPQFIMQATKQYADVPLASFYLGAIVLLCLHDSLEDQRGWLVMAGMLTGMAAWTKNEGLLFALVLVLVRCVVVCTSHGARAWVREVLPFALGLLPVLTVVFYFKFCMVGPGGDLAIQSGGTHDAMGRVMEQTPHAFLDRLLTVDRYLLIAKEFGSQVIAFGGWVVMLPPLLLMYMWVPGVNQARKDRPAIYTGLLTLILMTCGYFMVYVITPHNLAWHLNFSLDRVLMQLWPLAIFTFFLLVRTMEEAAGEGPADLEIRN
jgi:hypothetical protein